MAQVILAGPFEELDLGDQHRLQPSAVLHLGGRQTRTPATALRLWQIHERAILDFESAEFLEELLPDYWREAVTGARHVDEAVALVVAQDQGVKGPGADRVAADHKLLTPIDAHLLPRTGSQSGLVAAVQALRDQAFQPLRFHRLDEDRQARIKWRRVADRFAKFGQNLLLEQLTANLERFAHHVATGQHHDIEDEVQHRGLR